MQKLNEAIERIRVLQCPTGDVEERVTGILEGYGVAARQEISVQRDESLDHREAEGYRVELANNQDQTLKILAKSGMEDYVATVTHVSME